MLGSLLLAASLAFAESKCLALQIHLDRAGYSCNTIDGVWGRKSERALRRCLADRGHARAARAPLDTAAAAEPWFDRLFGSDAGLFKVVTVTQADVDALVAIPDAPADKARLDRLGYATICEMFAERGHLSQNALMRMNPGVDWTRVRPGLRLVIPDFPSAESELAAGERRARPVADVVRVSLSNFEITAWDARGRLLALFPCSIARDKAKLPPKGETKITTYVANPNYTYTPDYVPPGRKVSRHILPAGPNCPVGIVWMGLGIPGYGIHGTPHPESIGNAESHGCFRLANWNAARLYAMCRPGTRVVVEP